jgi:hypothetical protein
LYILGNYTRTSAGTQIVTLSLYDADYIRWQDNTREQLTFTFTIDKATDNEITNLQLDGWSYGDSANTPSANVKYGNLTYTYSDSEDGQYSPSVPQNAGTYYIKAEVNDCNDYNGAWKIATFTIAKKRVQEPAQDSTNYKFNGEEQTYFLPQSDLYSVAGDTHIDEGEYVVTVSLNDKDNCEWLGGGCEDLAYEFVIGESASSLLWLVIVLADLLLLELLVAFICWAHKFSKDKRQAED